MPHTQLILLRHGETIWNREHRIQGHLDSPLSEAGIAQAEALAERLAATHFDALYSSDLGRAQLTAQKIGAASGREIIAEAGLRERNLGILQALTRAEAQHIHPEIYARYRTLGPDYQVPGGESAQQFVARVADTCRALAEKHDGKIIVAVTHGGVLDAMYRHATGAPLDGARNTVLLNASVNRFDFVEGRWRLVTWGDVAHLCGASLDDV